MSEECAGLRVNIFEHFGPINLHTIVVIKPRIQNTGNSCTQTKNKLP